MTWAQTMVSASHWVGFTLPGMIELPGSFSGMRSSPIPQRGPEASHRTSLAILVRAAARARSAPCPPTSASWAASASNLLGADTKGCPVRSAITRAARSPNPRGALSPVPTAVPPSASSWSPGIPARMWPSARSSWLTQPEISCPSVSGTASWRWVRPILTTSAKARDLARRVSRSRVTAGTSRPSICSTTAMCMAVGKVSLEDWLRLTSSLGCTGCWEPSRPPRSSMARLAITSLAFMLVWVPLPVCQTESGKCSSSRPSITSSAASTIARALSSGRRPSSRLTSAQAFLRTPSARMISRGNRSLPIRKCSSDRWVWAPQ